MLSLVFVTVSVRDHFITGTCPPEFWEFWVIDNRCLAALCPNSYSHYLNVFTTLQATHEIFFKWIERDGS